MRVSFCRSDVPENHVSVELESSDMNMVSVVFYYWLVGGQFAMSADRPTHIPQEKIFELTIRVELNGIFGGPQVRFFDPLGHLLQLTRPGSHTNMSVNLPEGGVTARDGSGDWTKVIDLSDHSL